MLSLIPAFVRLAVERSFAADELLAPLFGTRSMVYRVPHVAAACVSEQQHWETFIADSRYDFVVLAARWQWLTEEPVYGKFRIPPQSAFGPDGKVPQSIHERRRIFEEGLRRTVKALLRTGAHVVLISQVPNIGKVDVSGCLERGSAKKDLQMGRQPAGCLGATRSTVMPRSQFVDGLITLLGNENEHVTAVAAQCMTQRSCIGTIPI